MMRAVVLGVTAGGVVLGGGCASPGMESTRRLAENTAFWKPHLLLATPDPYPSLRVEVDAVEGCAPHSNLLEDLREFLESHVDKPGGIRVELDDIIPREKARGRNSQSLALEYVNGSIDPRVAGMYVLYYDSGLCSDKKSNPATTLLPYPVSVFIDTAYGFMDPSYAGDAKHGVAEFGRLVLRHEAAHVLGLSRNPAHSDGLHCTNPSCLMSPKLVVDVTRLMSRRDPWRQRALCAACRADLAFSTAATPAPNVRFRGPYVVRSEADYQVLSLPGFVYVHLGPLRSLDGDRLFQVRREAIGRNRRGRVYYASSPATLAQVEAALPALLRDPMDPVRDLGLELQKKTGAEP